MRPTHRTLLVICAAIGSGILIMAVIAVALADTVASADTQEVTGILLPTFLVLGGAALVAAAVVRRRMMASVTTAPSLEAALARLRMGTILACAFSEVPAILGLTLVLITGSLTWAPLCFGAALVSLALSFPRMSQWEAVLASQPLAAPTIER